MTTKLSRNEILDALTAEVVGDLTDDPERRAAVEDGRYDYRLYFSPDSDDTTGGAQGGWQLVGDEYFSRDVRDDAQEEWFARFGPCQADLKLWGRTDPAAVREAVEIAVTEIEVAVAEARR